MYSTSENKMVEMKQRNDANEKMIYTILRGLQKELNIEKELSYLSLSLYVCTCTLHRNVM